MADGLAAQDKADPQPEPMTRYSLPFAPLAVNRITLPKRVVAATVKIATPTQAEATRRGGRADLVGFARDRLADPDRPKKTRLGQDDRKVRCIYGNVSNNLDEDFQQVRCGSLWPRVRLNAPDIPDDTVPPAWPGAGAPLSARLSENGQVRLTKNPAVDWQGVYGYEFLHAINGYPFIHLTASLTPTHVDEYARASNRYLYRVRAYDFAGNRSPDSNAAEEEASPGFAVLRGRPQALHGSVQAMERRDP